MAVAINRSRRGDRRFYSNVITDIKSHKPDGEVGVRNIHASSMNKREGLSWWVSRELQGPLTGHTWFLTSSAQLVADIKTAAEDSGYFVKLDVRDFFMTGTPSELKDSIKVLFPPGPQVQVVVRSMLSIFCPVSMSCLIWFRDVFFVLFVDQAWAIAIPGALLTVRFSRWGKGNLLQDHRCSRVSELSDTIATEMMF